jgi:hypothetical protein
VISSWNCKEVWQPTGDADPALEAGATAHGIMGSPAGGEIPSDNHKGECANYLLFKPLSVPGRRRHNDLVQAGSRMRPNVMDTCKLKKKISLQHFFVFSQRP